MAGLKQRLSVLLLEAGHQYCKNTVHSGGNSKLLAEGEGALSQVCCVGSCRFKCWLSVIMCSRIRASRERSGLRTTLRCGRPAVLASRGGA